MPEQIVSEDAVAVPATDAGPTFINTLSILAQLPSLPITTYVVGVSGVAITVAPTVVFNPVAGDQV